MSTNPFIAVISDIFTNTRTWIMTIIGVITLFKIAQYAMQYQGGEADEKAQAVKHIRNTVIMGGGAFFLIWFAAEVFTVMQNAAPALKL